MRIIVLLVTTAMLLYGCSGGSNDSSINSFSVNQNGSSDGPQVSLKGLLQMAPCKTETDKDNDGTIDSIDIYYYDDELLTQIIKTDDELDGVIDSTYINYYNKIGALIGNEYKYKSTNKKDVYDNLGNLIGTVNEASEDSVKWLNSYDVDGNLTETVYSYTTDDGVKLIVDEYVEKYDYSGKINLFGSLHPSRIVYYNNGEIYEAKTFVFFESNKSLVQLTENYDLTANDSMSVTFYNSLGKIIKQINDYDNDGTYDIAEYYEYDDNGRFVSYKADHGIDGTYNDIRISKYDIYGSVNYESTDYNGDNIIDILYQAINNPAGNRLESSVRFSDDSANDYSERYYYLPDGRLTRIESDLAIDGTINRVLVYNYDCN